MAGISEADRPEIYLKQSKEKPTDERMDVTQYRLDQYEKRAIQAITAAEQAGHPPANSKTPP